MKITETETELAEKREEIASAEVMSDSELEALQDEFDEAVSDARHALLLAVRLAECFPDNHKPLRAMACDEAYYSIC